jgi:hypothetical protein
MKRSIAALFATTLLVSPLPAAAQEGPEGNPVEMAETELLGILKSKGYADARIAQITATEDAIVIDGLTGSAPGSAFNLGRIEIKEIDAGYRWTRAKEVAFSNVNVTHGENVFHAEALLSTGFGILDIDSGQPGFAFDELAVVNGQWSRAGVSMATFPSLIAKGRQWKELYSIPATLDVKTSVTFSGNALLALLGQTGLPIDSAGGSTSEEAYAAEVTGRLSSTTSSGALTASLQVSTDKLGSHKFETILGGVDDALLSSYFARGDENVTDDPEKLKALKTELDRHVDDISIRNAFYQGSGLSAIEPLLSGNAALLSTFTTALVAEYSSDQAKQKYQNLIVEPINKFLAAPNHLEVDIIPARGTTLSLIRGLASSPETTDGRLLDVLGARVVAR